MQVCRINGKSFRLDNDGTIYINGNKVVENEVNVSDKFGLVLSGFILGLFVATLIFYL